MADDNTQETGGTTQTGSADQSGQELNEGRKSDLRSTKLADDGWFVKGTTASSVTIHELGHINCRVHGINPIEVVERVTGLSGRAAVTFLKDTSLNTRFCLVTCGKLSQRLFLGIMETGIMRLQG